MSLFQILGIAFIAICIWRYIKEPDFKSKVENVVKKGVGTVKDKVNIKDDEDSE